MRKEEKLREGLNRLLSEPTDPTQAERVLNKLTGQGSIPERLSAIKDKIVGLRSDVEGLSSLMEYHSGPHLSRVIDVLNQAEDLTEEAISLTSGQNPSLGFRVEDNGGLVSIWDDIIGVGIEFDKWNGESQGPLRYVQTEEATLKDDEVVGRTFLRLIEFARREYPQEFEHIPQDSLI